LPGGEVNVCGLFRVRPEMHLSATTAKALIRGQPATSLGVRLETAQWQEDSFCSVAGLALAPQRAQGSGECRLGDALTMIPPVTGNGMSMAFEAAELAVGPLSAYAEGKKDWDQTRSVIAQPCDAAFGRRLFWARLLQALMFSRALKSRVGVMMLNSDMLWRWLFDRTR